MASSRSMAGSLFGWKESIKLSNPHPTAATAASEGVEGSRAFASDSILSATSLDKCTLYSSAAREEYLDSTFPPSVTPCLRKNWAAFWFPPKRMVRSCCGVHSSRSTERTKVMCTPKARCVAEQL